MDIATEMPREQQQNTVLDIQPENNQMPHVSCPACESGPRNTYPAARHMYFHLPFFIKQQKPLYEYFLLSITQTTTSLS